MHDTDQQFCLLRFIEGTCIHLRGLEIQTSLLAAVRAKASVCGRSLSRILDSNPTGGGHGGLLLVMGVCYQVEV